MSPKLSIIIPVYNEFEQLEKKVQLLRHWKKIFNSDLEIIVIDSGSTDQSVKWFKKLQAESVALILHVNLAPNQGRSIGFAIGQACGEALADRVLILPIDIQISESQLKQLANRPELGEKWGCFFKKYESASLVLQIYCFFQNLILTSWLRQGVWTNAFFFNRELSSLVPVDGFLEDVLFSDQLKKISPGLIIKEPVQVNVRKYSIDGICRRIFYNGIIIFMYRCGYRNFRLMKELYNGKIGLLSLIFKSFK